MEKAKIAYISLWFPKPSETFIFREVAAMIKKGLDIKVYTLYGPLKKHLSPEMTAFAPQVETMGLKQLRRGPADLLYWRKRKPGAVGRFFKRFPFLKSGNLERAGENLWAFWGGLRIARRMAESLERGQGPTHIHSPWAGGPCTAAWLASELTGVPFSFAARAGEIYPPEEGLPLKGAAASFVRVNYAKNVSYLQGFVDKGGGEKDSVKLVYNALTLERHEPAPVKMAPPYEFLAMGRLVRTKGFDVLLDACKILQDRGLDFRLSMVGSGGWESRLKKQSRDLGLTDRVEFTGFLTHDRIAERLARADISITPSVVDPTGDRDGIPNVIMEAMSYGLPVAASDVTGISEVVRHDQTGILVPQRDPEALAAAITRLIENPDQARSMGLKARELVLDIFDQDKNCSRLIELFTNHGTRP